MNVLPQPVPQTEALIRCENVSSDEVLTLIRDKTPEIHRHKELFESYCPVQTYVDCPPEDVFHYMQNIHSLAEWTYGVRALRPTAKPDVFVGKDTLMANTDIYVKVEANASGLLVDYHCAWDQGEELWMIYLNRIVPAQPTLHLPGSVIFWQNCRHPYYDKNPYPDLAPQGRVWVGELWPYFLAGHGLEIQNLKSILEYRHHNNCGFDPKHTVVPC